MLTALKISPSALATGANLVITIVLSVINTATSRQDHVISASQMNIVQIRQLLSAIMEIVCPVCHPQTANSYHILLSVVLIISVLHVYRLLNALLVHPVIRRLEFARIAPLVEGAHSKSLIVSPQ